MVTETQSLSESLRSAVSARPPSLWGCSGFFAPCCLLEELPEGFVRWDGTADSNILHAFWQYTPQVIPRDQRMQSTISYGEPFSRSGTTGKALDQQS